MPASERDWARRSEEEVRVRPEGDEGGLAEFLFTAAVFVYVVTFVLGVWH
jgi:hypothetical protein